MYFVLSYFSFQLFLRIFSSSFSLLRFLVTVCRHSKYSAMPDLRWHIFCQEYARKNVTQKNEDEFRRSSYLHQIFLKDLLFIF